MVSLLDDSDSLAQIMPSRTVLHWHTMPVIGLVQLGLNRGWTWNRNTLRVSCIHHTGARDVRIPCVGRSSLRSEPRRWPLARPGPWGIGPGPRTR